MTNHKKGNEHWTSECKRIREERDNLLIELEKAKSTPSNDKAIILLREVYEMCAGYYANFEDVRDKIRKAGYSK